MMAAWKRFRWMAFPSMKKEKMPSGSPSNARSISEFTPVQENSNEDELAGPSAWLCDACKHGTGEQPGACTDARWCSGGDLQRCHYPSGTTGGGSRGRRRTSRRSRRPSAEPGSPGAGFRGRPPGGTADRHPGDIRSRARCTHRTIPAGCSARGCRPYYGESLPGFARWRRRGHLLRGTINDSRGFGAQSNNLSVPADGEDASGIRFERSAAPSGCGTFSEGFTDFISSLRFAKRTDPALSHSCIVQREEGSCSPGLHDGTSGGWARGAAGKNGRHDDGDIGGNAGNAGPGSSGSSRGKVYR